jgi:SulP family sulfate permease
METLRKKRSVSVFIQFILMYKEEFSHYNRQKFGKDLMAGVTAAAVALPLALAFGVASGATAAAGLITAVVAGVLISAFSGGFYQISGPTGAMAAILMGLSAQYGFKGILLATFIAGVILLVAGLLRLGVIASLIPAPVITGFTSGIAIVIALGQLDNLFGTKSTGSTALAKLWSYHSQFTPNIAALVFGFATIIFLIAYPKRLNQKIPGTLLIIILATAFNIFGHFSVATVGEIPKTLIGTNHLGLADLTPQNLKTFIMPGISIALLGLIESLLCGASAGRMSNKPLNNNQELVAQGIGNLLVPFFGGIPATAAIARTSVAIKSGAVTRLTGIFHALTLLAAMFVLAPIMAQIPLASLAGVLIITAWRMNEWVVIKKIARQKRPADVMMFAATMMATVVFDLSIAILIGIVLGLVIFVVKSANLLVTKEIVDFTRLDCQEDAKKDSWQVVYLTGPLFFLSSERLKSELADIAENEWTIFSMRGVPSIDSTALNVLADFVTKHPGKVSFSSLQPNVATRIKEHHTTSQLEFHDSVDQALLANVSKIND